jgi:hypothetical protein
MKWPFKMPKKWTEHALVYFTFGLLICAALQTAVLWQSTQILDGQRKEMERQREEMAGQRKEMSEAGKQTDRIIAEDRRLAAANERFAKATEHSVTQTKSGIERSLDLGRKSLEQSKRSLDRTIEMSWNDQRAWVGVTQINSFTGTKQEIKEGSTVGVDIWWSNSGKSPARGLRVLTVLNLRPSNVAFAPPTGILLGQLSNGILSPNSVLHSRVQESHPLTKDQAEGILSRSLVY